MRLFGKPSTSKPKIEQRQVRQWFASPAGQRLQDREGQLLQRQLDRFFGSYAVFFNPLGNNSRAKHIRFQVSIGCPDLEPELQCAESLWPVQPDSVDVLVLQHSLEFAESAHNLLREATQSIRPGGHIVIIGINPYSFFSLGRWLRATPWRQACFLSARRVSDWLGVLGFHLEGCSYTGYRPLCLQHEQAVPNGIERFLQRRQWPLANCYMITARKMQPGGFLQSPKKPAFDKLMPLPAASASRSAKASVTRHKETK